MKLSDHFTLEELTFSDTAARLGIDNSAKPEEMDKLRWLAMNLESVRGVLGPLHVNSAKRCLALNRAIGSKDTSQHLKLEAADLTSLVGLAPLVMCEKVVASDIQFDQIIYEFKSWMHISFAPLGVAPRRSILTIDSNGTRSGL